MKKLLNNKTWATISTFLPRSLLSRKDEQQWKIGIESVKLLWHRSEHWQLACPSWFVHRGEIFSMPSPLPTDTQRETPAACSTTWQTPSNTSTASTLCTETSNRRICWWVARLVSKHCTHGHITCRRIASLLSQWTVISLTLDSHRGERWLIPAALTPPARSFSSLPKISLPPPSPFCQTPHPPPPLPSAAALSSYANFYHPV